MVDLWFPFCVSGFKFLDPMFDRGKRLRIQFRVIVSFRFKIARATVVQEAKSTTSLPSATGANPVRTSCAAASGS